MQDFFYTISGSSRFHCWERKNLPFLSHHPAPSKIWRVITDTQSLLRGIPNGIRVLKSDDYVGVISSARFARSGLAFILAAKLRGILPDIIKKGVMLSSNVLPTKTKNLSSCCV